MQKVITIVGTTSAGKTGLAVALAKKLNGEVVSADSRQVYRGMDIGSGKDLSEYGKIPYHLIDVANPKTQFSLADFQKQAQVAVDDILRQGKLPIIAGGTGLYAQALIDNFELKQVKPNQSLRKKLEKETIDQLFKDLKKINPKFANKLNESDRKNKRRLIRYLEINSDTKTKNLKTINPSPKYQSLIIGLTWDKEVLADKIYKRLIERLEKENMIGEVERLRAEGVSWKRLDNFGLEYKWISYYLREKIDYDEMVERLFIDIKKFAKRQMTWLRRWEKQGAKIRWLSGKTKQARKKQAEDLVKTFLM